MRTVVADGNVFVFFFVERNKAQQEAALARIWPDPLTGLTDAAIVALATTNRYDAVATFDRKLANKLENFGLAAYF